VDAWSHPEDSEDDEADDKINDDDDGSKDSDDSSIDGDDDLVHKLEEHLNMTDVPDTFHVDIKFVFDEADAAGNQFGDTGSVKTFRSLCHSLYNKDNHDEYSTDNDASEADLPVNRKRCPGEMSIESASTQATSTLTGSTNNPEEAFLKLCQANPNLLQNFLQSNLQLKIAATNPGASEHPGQQTDPPKASPNKEGDRDEGS
jgi:hypothetical protein